MEEPIAHPTILDEVKPDDTLLTDFTIASFLLEYYKTSTRERSRDNRMKCTGISLATWLLKALGLVDSNYASYGKFAHLRELYLHAVSGLQVLLLTKRIAVAKPPRLAEPLRPAQKSAKVPAWVSS